MIIGLPSGLFLSFVQNHSNEPIWYTANVTRYAVLNDRMALANDHLKPSSFLIVASAEMHGE